MTGMILVVDDERDLAATCERLLRRSGWNVAIAGSREAALTMLARHPRPVLAIVDRQLPDGDGVDVLRAALAVGTPVIVVTGYGSGATRRLTLEEGAVGFLAKPFSATICWSWCERLSAMPRGPHRAHEPDAGP